MMTITTAVKIDVDPVQYANIYGISVQEAEGEIPGYLAQVLQNALTEARAIGDRRHWITGIEV